MLCAQLKFHLDNIFIYVSVLNKYDYLLNPDTILHLLFFFLKIVFLSALQVGLFFSI